ncbi:hypothetical protein BJX76DRAFT_363287 [Aspergillus varians]
MAEDTNTGEAPPITNKALFQQLTLAADTTTFPTMLHLHLLHEAKDIPCISVLTTVQPTVCCMVL